jgi:tRNA 2-thiouridine synthesizing protein A
VQLPGDDDELLPAGALDARTAALQGTVAGVAARPCGACGASLCGHEALLSVVLGSRNAPRCARCAAAAMGEEPAALLERALQWIRRRDCFAHVWRRAGIEEGQGDVDRPACVFGDSRHAGAAPTVGSHGPAPRAAAAPVAIAAAWDAGDLGCGDLVLELRMRLRELPPGAVLQLTARDPAAPVDLPAWCGLVGHALLSSAHPDYLIQRKRD